MIEALSTATRPLLQEKPVAATRSTRRRLGKVLCLADFEALAQRHLPRPLFGYIAGASETNLSLADNTQAFAELGFRPRVLVDVSARHQRTKLFGQTFAAPFGIAPMGISAMMAYRGDVVLAAAAQTANIPMIMSGSSLIPLEEVANAAPTTSWFQAYLPGEPSRIDALLDRIETAGFQTLVITVDVATLPSRENNVRAGFSTPLRPSARLLWQGLTHPSWSVKTLARTLLNHGVPHFENSFATRGAPIISRNVSRDFSKRDHLNWSHLEQIRKRWKGILVVKGIMRPEDAVRAASIGVDGIIISNHGGRQLDGTLAPLRVLPGIKTAAGSTMTIMMDGGIRRGTDVLKALVSGADFVFVGRPFLYAASVGGQFGVAKAIDLLSNEIHQDMALLGVTQIGDLSSDLLCGFKVPG
ncbi:alpha-hydroxy acid oxidase [Phyllobacterium sp. SB3]|uniref:alpha-hydroxy acid oxidase n=1 Tax=Phyllobacterium sp. SB3 TaxID=3156073 RepID=UPI0032AE8CB8